MSHDGIYKNVLQSMLTTGLRSNTHECPRGKVGTALFDKDSSIVSTGVNGRPFQFGECDCNDNAPTLVKGSATCRAVHSEIVALMSVPKGMSVYTAVVTRPPCRTCLSALAHAGVKQITTTDEYPDRDESEVEFVKHGSMWRIIPLEDLK